MNDLVALGVIAILGCAFFGVVIWAVLDLFARIARLIVSKLLEDDEKKKRWGNVAVRTVYGLGISFVAFSFFRAVFPSDDFFARDFEMVVGQKAPSDLVVTQKYATYPDIHGDNCSYSRMSLNAKFYSNLLNQLKLDRRFSVQQSNNVSTGQAFTNHWPPMRVTYEIDRVDQASDHHYSIWFLQGEHQIEVQVCTTRTLSGSK